MAMTRAIRIPATAVLAACMLLCCKGHKAGLDGSVDVAGESDLVEDPDVAGPDVPDVGHEADVVEEDGDDPSTDVLAEPDNPCVTPDADEDVIVDADEDLVDEPDADDAESDLTGEPDADDAGDDLSVEPDVEEDVVDDAEADLPGEPDACDATSEDGTCLFTCGDVLRDPRDGQTYATVLIGTQCWMAENLNVGTMLPISTSETDNGVIEKHCYDDDPANCTAKGALYRWNEMMDYGPSDAGNPSTTQGICPPGWHVPSDEEFKVLEMYVGMTRTEADMVNAWRGVGAGTALKPGGSSGYDALMSGRFTGGVYELIDLYEYMYTSTEWGSLAWRRCLGASAATVGRWNTFPKSWALSVRCVLN
jgi:uncharacterized protein (TIGR02145 family)